MNHHLASNADIVHNPTFESAIVKIQRGDERLLTVAEARQVQQFLRTNVQPQQEEKEESQDYATSILRNKERGRRARTEASASAYVSLNHLSGTSNICEKLFSVTEMIMADRRKSLESFHLEMLIFLNYNKELWTEVTMQDILSAPAEPPVAMMRKKIILKTSRRRKNKKLRVSLMTKMTRTNQRARWGRRN